MSKAFDEYLKKKRGESSNTLSSSSTKGSMDEYIASRRNGFDTIASDEREARKILNSVYSGWNSASDMASKRNTVQNMYDRLSVYSQYNNSASDIANAYKKALDDWDNIAGTYGQYQTKDAYDSKKNEAAWVEKNKGLTYDQVQERLKTASLDERDYLSRYGVIAGYDSLSDYDKELSNLNKASKAKDVFNALVAKVPGKQLGEYTDEEKYYADLNKKRNEYQMDHAFDEYKKLENNADFAANASKEYKELNPSHNVTLSASVNRSSNKYADVLDGMTDEEKQVANYIGNVYGSEEYKKYMDDMRNMVQRRSYEEEAEPYLNAADNVAGAAGLTLASYATNLLSEPFTLAEEAAGLVGGNYSPYTGVSRLNTLTSDVRQRVGENIAEDFPNANLFGVNVPEFLYQVGNSTVDSVVGARVLGAIGYGATGTKEGAAKVAKTLSIFMGSGAFNQAYREGIENGMSDDQAMAVGLANGINEALFEEISLDRLLKDHDLDSLGKSVLNVLAQAGVEGSEEVFTDMANTIAENVILGNQSDMAIKARELAQYGYSEAEIKKILAKEYAAQLAESFIGGALSGGAMGGYFTFSGSSDTSYTSNKKYGEGIRSNLRIEDLGSAAENISNATVEDKSDAGEYLSALKEKYNNDLKKASDAELGVLYKKSLAEAVNAVSTNHETDLKNYAEGMLLAFGETDRKASVMAESIAKKLTGQELDADDKNVLELENAKDVVSEILNYGTGEDSKELSSAINNINDIKNISFRKEGSIKNAVIKDNGKVEITNEDGSVEKTKLAKLDPRTSALIRESENYTGSIKEIFLSNYAGQNLALYSNAFDLIEKSGEAGTNVLDDEETLNTLSKIIPMKDIASIYKEALKLGNTVTEEKIAKLSEAKKKWEGQFKKGTFRSELDRSKLSNKEKMVYDIAEAFSSIGINMHVINDPSLSKDGFYTSKGNEITINLAARYSRSNSINTAYVITAMSHELTHWMEYQDIKFGHEKDGTYSMLKTLIRNDLGEEKWNKYVKDEQDKWEKRHKDDEDYKPMPLKNAESEVVARACERMLNDTETLAEVLRGADDTLIGRINNAIKEFFNAISDIVKEILGIVDPGSDIAKEIESIEGEFARLRNVWIKGFSAALEYNQRFDQKIDKVGLVSDGSYVYPSLNSQQTYGESDYATNEKIAAQAIAEKIGVSPKVAAQYIHDVGGVAEYIRKHSALLDYTSVEGKSAWVSNPEYGGSVDFSFLCPKRLTYTGTMNAIRDELSKKKMDVPFSVTDFLFLRSSLKSHGVQSPCSFCFVESARMRFDKYNKKFIKNAIRDGLEYIPTFAELNNPDELERLSHEHKETYEAYISYLNTLSQRKPKMLEERRAYNGDILKAFTEVKKGKNAEKETTIEEKNRHGGIRFNSFSDFEVVHMIDAMQAILDMSRIGLAGFGYTKQKGFAEVFGTTGLKINLSCVAKGVSEDGMHIIFDDYEGMNSKDALEVRNNPKYSKNVGICCVVFTDEQLMAALCDERIDYVLPFHRSQWSSADYAKLGLPDKTKDYTKAQTEKGDDNKRLKEGNTPFLSYWDFTKDGKWNVQHYLDTVINNSSENAEKPLFSQVLDQDENGNWIMYKAKDSSKAEQIKEKASDNYWKLLTEFKLYDNSGKPSDQYAVKPTFNMEAAYSILEKYDGSHTAFPVDNDAVKEFIAYKENGTIPKSEVFDGFRTKSVPKFDVKYVKAGETAIDKNTGKLKLSNKKIQAEDIDQAIMIATDKGLNVDIDATIEYFEDSTSLNSEQLDNEYMEAVKNNDIEKLQKMVDEAAKREGFNVKAYHGTTAGDFTIFRTKENDNNMGSHFGSKEIAEGFASGEFGMGQGGNPKVYSVYLKANNPYETYDWFGQDDFYPAFEALDMAEQIGTDEAKAIADQIRALNPEIGEMWESGDLDEGYLWPDKEKYETLYRLIRELLDLGGYDSILYENGLEVVGEMDWIIQHPEQIKIADPITYDDNGNVIPLSKRFDLTNEDIRYSEQLDATEEKAVEIFGTTDNFEEAGYILTDGSLLKFASEKGTGSREYDHRAIAMAYGKTVDLNKNHGFDADATPYLNRFVEDGAIRIDTGDLSLAMDIGLQLSSKVALTSNQEQTIRDLIEWKMQREEQYDPETDESGWSLYTNPLAIRIDFGGDGDIAVGQISEQDLTAWGKENLVYQGSKINPYKVISDIRTYYKTGKAPKQSDLAIFYSEQEGYAPAFYSKMGREISNIKSDKIGAASVVSYLKGKGIKDEEIKWSGIETFLEGKKSVTKAELEEFVKSNQLKIEEKTLGNNKVVDDRETGETYSIDKFKEDAKRFADENGYTYEINEYDTYIESVFYEDGEEVDSYEADLSDGTNWSDYTTEGTKNYREILFKLPGSDYSNQSMSAHWGEKGVLAHARIGDQTTSDGSKMLFIEEIQSDWHNAGAKKGYASNDKVNKGNALYKLRTSLGEKMSIRPQGFDSYANWFNEISQNASLGYRLEKNNDSFVLWNNETLELNRDDYSEFRNLLYDVLAEADYEANELNTSVPEAPFANGKYIEYVMKRLLRMAAEEGYDSIGWTTAQMQSDRWSDEYAEGYRIEYDQDIPKFMNKYGKQWGVKVGKTELDTGDWFEEKMTEVWSVPITDAMKQSVLYEGQTLFSIQMDDLNEHQKSEIDNTAITLLNVHSTNKENYIEWLLQETNNGQMYKSVETRNYEIVVDGKKLKVGDRVGLVSTGMAKNRGMLMGYATISNILKWTNEKDFRKAYKLHRVPAGSDYDFSNSNTGEKYGYEFTDVVKLDEPIPTVWNGPSGTRKSDLLYLEQQDSDGSNLTNNQVKFFKDSEVRDKNGNLLVMYHGSVEEFTKFDKDKIRSVDYDAPFNGFWFSNDPGTSPAMRRANFVKKVYLNITNPAPTQVWKKLNKQIEREYFNIDNRQDAVRSGARSLNDELRYRLQDMGYDGIHWESRINIDWDEFDRTGRYDFSTIRGTKYYIEKDEEYGGITLFYADGEMVTGYTDKEDFEDLWNDETWVAFEPNQIKLADNLNPTMDDDTRFSDQEDAEYNELRKAVTKLEKQNSKLKDDIKNLEAMLKLDKTITKGKVLDPTQLRNVANELISETGSSLSADQVVRALKETYDYIIELPRHSDDARFNETINKAKKVARLLLENQKGEDKLDVYSKQVLDAIRKSRVKFDDVQKAEAINQLGQRYRDSFMGNIVIVKDGIELDSWWQDMAATYPGLFDPDVNSADMPLKILEIVRNLKMNKYDKLDSINEDDLNYVAESIYEKFWKIATYVSTADKYNDQINKLKEEYEKKHKEYTKNLSESYSKTISKRIAYAVQQQKESDKEYWKSKLKEDRNNLKDAALRKATIEKITKNVMDLNKWAENKDKKHMVPKALKGPVEDLLRAIDFSSKKLLNSGIPTQKDINFAQALERLSRVVINIDAAQSNNEAVDLSTYLDLPPQFAVELSNLSEQVNNIARKFNDGNAYVLNYMTLNQLEELLNAVRIMKKSVTNFNKLLANANAHSVDSIAQKTIEYAKKVGSRKLPGTKSLDFFAYDQALPYYAFKRFGSGASEMFDELRDGWDQFAYDVKKIKDYAESIYTSKQVNEWSNQIHTIKVLEPSEDGSKAVERTIKLTTSQIMSLYCLSKREQAKGHLLGGGIVPTDIVVKDKAGFARNKIAQPNAVRITDTALNDILSLLTKEQIDVADGIQKYMNTTLSDWGNDITMKRFGILGFTEENYFPIKSDSNIVGGGIRDNEKSIYALLNMSFTKALTKNANNQIMIDDIFNVFAVHASDMAKYHSLALPVLDMIKWWNYKEKNENGRVDRSTRIALDDTFGKAANSYIFNFLSDLNGAKESRRGEDLPRKMLHKYKAAAVGANLQVALLQPLSYIRAYNVMDAKYLNKALTMNVKKGMEESAERSGLTIWKDFGFFSTDIARGLDSLIRQDQNVIGDMVEKSMSLAGKMDALTWGILWNAATLEVKEKNPGLEVGSEEYYKAVNDRMRDVIYATQVIDSTMTRSDVMRSTNLIAALDSAFLSEPTISYNVFMDRVSAFTFDAKLYGKGESFKRHGKSIAKALELYLVSALVESALRTVISNLRGSADDDKELTEQYFNQVMEELNPLTKIPYIKSVVEVYENIMDGYSNVRMDEQWIASYAYAVKALRKVPDEGWSYKTTYKLLKAVSQMSGLPLGSALNEITTIWNFIFGNMFPDLKIEK